MAVVVTAAAVMAVVMVAATSMAVAIFMVVVISMAEATTVFAWRISEACATSAAGPRFSIRLRSEAPVGACWAIPRRVRKLPPAPHWQVGMAAVQAGGGSTVTADTDGSA